MHSIIRDHWRIYSFFHFKSFYDDCTEPRRDGTVHNSIRNFGRNSSVQASLHQVNFHVQKASKVKRSHGFCKMRWSRLLSQIIARQSPSCCAAGKMSCIRSFSTNMYYSCTNSFAWEIHSGWSHLGSHRLRLTYKAHFTPLLEPRVLFLLSSGSSNNLKSLSLSIFIFSAFQGRKWKILNC